MFEEPLPGRHMACVLFNSVCYLILLRRETFLFQTFVRKMSRAASNMAGVMTSLGLQSFRIQRYFICLCLKFLTFVFITWPESCEWLRSCFISVPRDTMKRPSNDLNKIVGFYSQPIWTKVLTEAHFFFFFAVSSCLFTIQNAKTRTKKKA